MRLPRFEYLVPADLDEALELLEVHGSDCRVLAGGTDLLVRMKQRLHQPRYLMSLKVLDDLEGIREEGGHLVIGSRTPLREVIENEEVKRRFPALSEAARSVGAPTIQHHRGTIGGNLLQDTRCLFYNQSAFWRSTKPPCHKAGGQVCYAREGSDRCRSTHQSDTAPVLMALDASVTLERKGSVRRVKIDELFRGEGENPLAVEPQELMSRIEIPLREEGWGNAYERLSYRSAIDYPIGCAAASVRIEGDRISEASVVIGAITNAPLKLARANELLGGRVAGDEEALRRLSEMAVDHALTFAVDNVGSTVEYRAKALGALVRRAVVRAAARAQGT